MSRPPFAPRPGQVDYTHIRWSPVINCVLHYQDRFLIVKRSADLNFYPSTWNGISGFLDDNRDLEEKVREELQEELSLSAEHIVTITRVGLFEQDDALHHKTWIVHPMLVAVDTDQIKIDWEAQEYAWVTLAEARTHELLPGFAEVLDSVKAYISLHP